MMDIDKLWKGWRIEALIGEGSFGKVYKIVKEELGYTYKAALKVIQIPQNSSEINMIRHEGLSNEETLEYFRNMVENLIEEVVLMSKLKGNSYIVGYEDHIVMEKEEGYGWDIFIRMELLTPLFQYIECNNFTVKDVVKLGIDMCKALEICQKNNVIHRDIKPENIFVSEMGIYKLGDFGIARQLEKTSLGLSKKGTYIYMAPEVYKGLPYNSTVDIYSLGIVLYRLLNNNRTPFMPPAPKKIQYTDKENAIILRLNGEKIPNPCNAQGKLAEIILKACAYEMEDRYQSPTDMRIDLEQILEESTEKEILSFKNNKLKNSEQNKVGPETVEQEETVCLFNEDNKNSIMSESKDKGITKKDIKTRLNIKGRKQKLLLGSIAIVMIAIGITFFLVNRERYHVVPNYIGVEIDTLKAQYFDVIVDSEEYSDKIEKGKIISQNIKAGEKLKKGSVIKVVISKGTAIEVAENVVKIFIGTSNKSRSYMAIHKGDISEEYSFTVSNYVVNSYEYESTNEDCFAITETENGGIVVNALSEGTGYVILNVETIDGTILKEKILVSVYEKVEPMLCTVNKKCNIYKAASDQSEGDNYNTKGVLQKGYKAEIRSSCGDYYIIKTTNGDVFSDKKDTGFVKKSDIDIDE